MTTKPKEEMKKTSIIIRYEFSEIELGEKAQSLARNCSEKQQIEDDKKQITSEYKFKLDSKSAEINLLSTKITNKYEMRRVDALMQKDYEKSMKIYFDVITKKEIHREKFTADDYQLELDN